MSVDKVDIANIYQPPSVPASSLHTSTLFYVVSKKKFFILFIATFTFYSFYWFWKQWSKWREVNDQKIWPIARAIFAIFFAYGLFEEIQSAANNITSATGERLPNFAIVYIIAELAFNLIDKIPMIGIIYLILTVLIVGILSLSIWQAQAQANIASLDSEGLQNSSFTATNYIWIALGTLFWLLIIISSLLSAFVEY